MLDDGRSLGHAGDDADDPRRAVEILHLVGPESVFRRWKMVCLWGALFFILGVLVAILKPITYTASTQLLIYNKGLNPGPEAVISPGAADLPQVENMIEIFKSRNVLTRVIAALQLTQDDEFASNGLPLPIVHLSTSPRSQTPDERRRLERALELFQKRLTVARVGTSHTVLVSFTSSDPNKAALVANEIARSASQVLTNTDSGSLGAPLLRERLQGLGPSAYVISAAAPPIRPDGWRRAAIVLAATVAGLMTGAAMAVVLDFLDPTIRTGRQVEHFLGLECFGVIPDLRRSRKTSQFVPRTPENEEFVTDDTPGERGTKKYPDVSFNRNLRRAHLLIQSMRDLRIIGVTAAAPRGGATTVAANLAYLNARPGKRVLIVNSSRCAHSGGAMTGESRGSAKLSPCKPMLEAGIIRDKRTGLEVISIGDTTGVDTDATWLARLNAVLCGVATSYDLVIVDLPSLASGPDVRMAAHKLDGLLLVIKWGGTAVELIERGLDLSGRARSKFVGAVLNMADERLIGRYGDKMAGAEAAAAATYRAPK